MGRPTPHEPSSVGVGDGDLNALLDRMQAVFATPPSDEVAEAHLAAILEAARGEESAQVVPLRARPRRAYRVAAVAAAATLALATSLTGLAYAGVIVLPDPAVRLLDRIGIDVPRHDGGGEHEDVPDPASTIPTVEQETTPPSPRPSPTRSPADEADDRARQRGDNADERSEVQGDNADDPGSQSELEGDNANERSDGDNAGDEAGDTASTDGDVAP